MFQPSSPASSDSWLQRLESQDPALFDPITSSATTGDRRSLLALQSAVRRPGGYAYLEIGSEQGGSLQNHVIDPWCTTVYSIDLRVFKVPDVRGNAYAYYDNTTKAMVERLTKLYPRDVHKLRTFDCRASEVALTKLNPAPDLIFIDGEHTRSAVKADFAMARRAIAAGGLIAFHDAKLVHQGIKDCLQALTEEGIEHHSAGLADAVYVIALGSGASERIQKIKTASSPPDEYFRDAAAILRQEQLKLLHYRFRRLLRRCRQALFS